MKRKIIKIAIPLLLIAVLGTSSLAITKKMTINKDTFSLTNKKEKSLSSFDNRFNVSSSDGSIDEQLKDTITYLTKKTTYLLLGEPNMQNESSENYYKRYKDYLELRYAPEIPKDENSLTGFDENSQEFEDNNVSGISIPTAFQTLNELEIKYSTYDGIRVIRNDDKTVTSFIELPNATIKEEDSENPMNYTTVKKDLTIYYMFKELNGEYKLYHLNCISSDDIQEYMENNEEEEGALTKNSSYNSSGLKNLYAFSKADEITDETLNRIYEENKDNVVYLNSTYNLGTVASANGIFINEGLILTTYNYIEQSLMKAQNIIISDVLGNVYELDGIVTMNIENDTAILKVKNKNQNYIKIEEANIPSKEDGVISLNTETGVGLSTSKGIVLTVDSNIQTSIPISEELQGSPLFNSEGKIIGMLNSKNLNSEISSATKCRVLKEYYDKFSNVNYDDVKAIPFEELKEDYYIKYNDETVINDIPDDKLKEYNNIENANDLIDLKLIKSSYKDGIVSLRYKNDIKDYMDTMQFASKYTENLKNNGYKESYVSDTKKIYKNGKYQIIVMEEFDYLIIVMVKL